MRKLIVLIGIFFLYSFAAAADNIEYGYNSRGEYVPTKIDGKQVEYGYNSRGEYVPTKVGHKNIGYGYNSRGQYVPVDLK